MGTNRTKRALAFFLILSTAAASVAQRPVPEPKALLLPIVGAGSVESDVFRNSMLARAAVLGALHERAFWVVPKVQLDAIAKSRQIDLESKQPWSPEAMRTLAEPFKVRYVIGGTLNRATVTTGTDSTVQVGEAQFTGWIYDLQKSEYVIRDREGTSKVESTDLKKEQASPGVLYQSIRGAVGAVFNEFLQKFPKPKPKKG